MHVPFNRFVMAITIFFTPEDAKETATSWKGSVLEESEMRLSTPRRHLWGLPGDAPASLESQGPSSQRADD